MDKKCLTRISVIKERQKAKFLTTDSILTYTRDLLMKCIISSEKYLLVVSDELFDIGFYNGLPVISPNYLNKSDFVQTETTYSSLIDLDVISRTLEKLEKIYNQQVLGTWRTVDLLSISNELKTNIDPYPFIPNDYGYTFNASEFYDLQQVVKSYQKYTNNEEKLIDVNIYRQFYNVEEIFKYNLDTLTEKSYDWLKSLNNLKSQLQIALHNHIKYSRKVKTQAINEQQLAIKREKSQLELFKILYGSDPVKKPTLLSSAYIKERYLEWQKLSVDETDVDKVLQLKKSESEQLTSELAEELKRVVSIKHLNALNTNVEGFEVIKDQLLNLYQSLNNHLLFREEIILHDKSFVLLLKQIDEVIERIKPIQFIKRFKSHIEWHQKLSKVSKKFQSFLDQLSSCPKSDWVSQFEYHYINQVLQQYYSNEQQHCSFEFFSQGIKGGIDAVLNQYSEVLKRRLLQHKLLNKKTQKIISSVDSLFDSIKELPLGCVCIIPERDFISNEYLPNITFIESTSEDDICIATSGDIDFEGTAIIYNLLDTQPFQSLTAINQLHTAKKLAYSLNSIITNLKGFQLKSCNVLLCVHEHWKIGFEELIINNGAKEFHLSDQDELTNFLLVTDRPMVICFQDGLLNHESSTQSRQLMLLSVMKKLGFQLLDFKLEELINNEYKSKLALVISKPITSNEVNI